MNPRDILGKEVVELSNTYNAMLLNHVTGTGKTKISLDIAATTTNKKHLIVHYETTHKDNIMLDIIKFGFNPDDYTFTTYRSVKKYIGLEYGCIILDECHHLTPSSLVAIRKIKCEKFVALSAEVPKDKLQLLFELAPSLYVHKVNLKLAIELNILPVPKIKLHWLELDNITKKDVTLSNLTQTDNIKYCTSYNEFKTLMDSNGKWVYHIKANLTDKEHYQFINALYLTYVAKIQNLFEQVALINRQILKDPSVRFKANIPAIYEQINRIKLTKQRLGGRRKNMLSATKTEYTENLFNSLHGKKLVFTNSISSANRLSDNHIHSKVTDKKIVKQKISDFKEGVIEELACVNMLKESHNIPDLKHVIYQQMDISSLIGFIQVRGRALRSEETILHLILTSDTIDENIINNLKENNLLK